MMEENAGPAEDFDVDARFSCAEKAEPARRRPGDVEQAPRYERPAIINAEDERPVVVEISDFDPGA